MKLRWLWNAWDYSCVIWCIWQISRVTNCTRKIFQGFVFEQTLLNFTRTSSQFQKCTFNTIYGKHWLLKNCCSRVTTFNFSGVNSCQRFFPCRYIFEVWMRTTKGTLTLQIEKKILRFFNNLYRFQQRYQGFTYGAFSHKLCYTEYRHQQYLLSCWQNNLSTCWSLVASRSL